MSALPSDLIAMKDSPTYLPILRSVLKSQIQFLVEQLSGAGEETLVLSANVNDGLVDQFGSESGKLFANIYDDFKSEFLGFCQKRKGKRKLDSPHKIVEAKRGKPAVGVLALPKTPGQTQTVQAIRSTSNVPKVSSARVITNPKSGGSSQESLHQVSDSEELGVSEEGYTEMAEEDAQYEEEEEQGEEWEESGEITPSSSQAQPATSKVKMATVVPKENTSFQKKASREVKEKGKDSAVDFEKMFSKAVSCTECGKLFIRGDALKLHMMSHTGENPYTCIFCGIGYRKKGSYIQHLKNKHPDEYVDMSKI